MAYEYPPPRLKAGQTDGSAKDAGDAAKGKSFFGLRHGKRREYMGAYLRWLRPHRSAIGSLFFLALIAAGLELIEPLFMRFIVDQILLNTGLDTAARLHRLHLAGALFVGVVVLSKLVDAFRDYRQKLTNVRVMLSLRQSLFDRLLHLPLPKIWDMKTGGILSRLTGDVDTTTGLLQMAIMSPAISIIRLIVAVILLLNLNWRLALTALAILPGIMLMSLRRLASPRLPGIRRRRIRHWVIGIKHVKTVTSFPSQSTNQCSQESGKLFIAPKQKWVTVVHDHPFHSLSPVPSLLRAQR